MTDQNFKPHGSVATMVKHQLNELVRAVSCPRAMMIAASFLPVFAVIHFVSYWLRFEGVFSENRWYQLTYTLLAVLCIKTCVFTYYNIYQGWSRYATFYDLVALAQAATVSAICLGVFDYLFLASLHISRAVFFMDWGATIVVVGGLRSARRWLTEVFRLLESHKGVPTLIVGADDYGEAILRAVRRGDGVNYNVLGFVAAKRADRREFIGGVPVVGEISETMDLAIHHQVRELLIASSGLNGKQVRDIVRASADNGIHVKVLPGYNQLLDGQVDLKPRTVLISDLLRRDPVQLDTEYLDQWLRGKTLLVTGASGSIGSEICRQLLRFKPGKLVVLDRSENGQFYLDKELRKSFPDANIDVCIGDIADKSRMADLFRTHQPNVVFHAAAYKHVPLMEINCSEAIKNIPIATRNLADLADQYGVSSFVMISTDKAVNPTSVMGCAKRVAEIYVQALAAKSSCRFVTVRFGNVLGSNGSVVPVFSEQIASGGPVTVTHPDMQRYFMMIPEASQLVIQAGAMGKGGEIFVLDMGEPVKIVDLAKDMIRLSGLRVGEDIEIQFSGVRPGEKLFEELHIHGEEHVATNHPKIMVARCQETTLNEISDKLNKLHLATRRSDEEIVVELADIVPEFKPTRFGQPTELPTERPRRKAA